ncbi:MAG: Rieske 2Fe-2S domain-containing protein [Candidatus Caenarcaniphilales bacterium]|nr:Rieske 2Fe-2S domain-containing protein [Candidatus Caenarcaniphilales bacterium]
MDNFIKVASLNELSETEGKAIKINNHNIALFKLASGEVYAIENSCPHVGAPLHNGTIEGKELTCLWHSWCFDLETGESTNCPGVSIKKFQTKVEDQSVFLCL